jgi:hypothetical protein
MLQIRKNINILNHVRLSKEYIADQWAKIEKMRLDWINIHQRECKAALYDSVVEFVKTKKSNKNNDNNKSIGHQHVVLPPSFKGSPRYYNECFYDAINIANSIDSPCIIATMTCNPEWKEITENLELNESAFNRVDLLDRFFKMKLNSFVKDIFQRHVLGFTVGKIIVIEFQQRGLPHAHILIIMDKNDRPITPKQFDELFQATIPDEKKNHYYLKKLVIIIHMTVV